MSDKVAQNEGNCVFDAVPYQEVGYGWVSGPGINRPAYSAGTPQHSLRGDEFAVALNEAYRQGQRACQESHGHQPPAGAMLYPPSRDASQPTLDSEPPQGSGVPPRGQQAQCPTRVPLAVGGTSPCGTLLEPDGTCLVCERRYAWDKMQPTELRTGYLKPPGSTDTSHRPARERAAEALQRLSVGDKHQSTGELVDLLVEAVLEEKPDLKGT